MPPNKTKKKAAEPVFPYPPAWPDERFDLLVLDDALAPAILPGHTIIIASRAESAPIVGHDVLMSTRDGVTAARRLVSFENGEIRFSDGHGNPKEVAPVGGCMMREIIGVMYRFAPANPVRTALAEKLRCERIIKNGSYPQPNVALLQIAPLEPDLAKAMELMRAELNLH